MATFTLSPASYTTQLENEVVALDLAIAGEGFVEYQQSFNMNIDGVDYYAGRYSNLTGADPWHIPFTIPNVVWGGIPPKPPEMFPPKTYQIFFQSCDQNAINDGLIVSNTASITFTFESNNTGCPWWLLLLALLGIGGGYYAYKKLS